MKPVASGRLFGKSFASENEISMAGVFWSRFSGDRNPGGGRRLADVAF
jgi:hypothetical protein